MSFLALRSTRAYLRAFLAVFSIFLSAARAGAQVLEPEAVPPTIAVSPASGGTVLAAALTITLDFAATGALEPTSFVVTLNGANARNAFTYTPGANANEASAAGSVTLVPGYNTLAVEIWDRNGNHANSSFTYSYVRPPPSLPAPAPSALPRPTSGDTITRRDVVDGVYRLVLEREGDPAGVNHWIGQMDAGVTVKQMLRVFATSAEYQANFVAGLTAEQVVAGVYRHVYAREAAPNEVSGWAPVATSQGWIAVVDGLLNDAAYGEWFGEHVVPGQPVTLWDVERASLIVEPGTATANVERALCLTVSAGPGAAYECGDLRLVHGLPSVRSGNKSRGPVLLYNAQHANPMPTVAARVRLPAERGTPTQVVAVLSVGPRPDQLVERARRNWAGGDWTPGQARRIVLAYSAAGEVTGVREYALQVVATYPDGSTAQWTTRGSLAVVNRETSAFGAGWWLAGLEQIACIECGARSRILWVGGDGSTRVYEPGSAAGVWVAPRADGIPDTLRTFSYPGVAYIRNEPGGVKVYYNIAGQHVATANRLGYLTQFIYVGGRLSEVRVPVARSAAAPLSFGFEYGGPGTTLSRVTAPDLNGVSGRPTTLEHGRGDERITAILDPDGGRVSFDVDPSGAAPRRITRRRTRTGTDTNFHYDAGGKLDQIQTDMRGTGDNITTNLAAAETRGLVGAPVAPRDVNTKLDGPRTDAVDVTWLWLDRFGAPWRIVDAGNRETVVTRSDPRFPALATRTDGPVRADGGRLTVSASYTARGNLEAQTDWSEARARWVLDPFTGQGSDQTAYATTRYAYEDAAWPDFPTRVTSPEGEVSRTQYRPDGNRDWQQPGDDATRRVTFGYNAGGLVETVTQPVVNGSASTETFVYDNFGNLSATVQPATAAAPLGYRTVMRNDTLGRTWRTESPVDTDTTRKQITTTEFYPGTDRVRTTVTQAPLLYGTTPNALQTLKVENWYDADGLPRRVDRTVNPDPSNLGIITLRWERDAAGRVLAEFAPDATPLDSTDNPVERTVYDAAGNVKEFRSRRREVGSATPLTITMTYDALNRLRTRAIPEAHYGPRPDGIPSRFPMLAGCTFARADPLKSSYPYRANDNACGYRIAATTELFEYDEVGNLIAADNADARVRRTYATNGALRTETETIRTVTGNLTTSPHVYLIRYVYDLNGRLREVYHPTNLAPTGSAANRGRTSYTYAPATGELETVTDVLGNVFTYGYNARGETQTRTQHPATGGAAAVVETYGYDAVGNLLTRTVDTPRQQQRIFEQNLTYDLRGKLRTATHPVGPTESRTNSYSGLGHLVTQTMVSTANNNCPGTGQSRYQTVEEFTNDALGNLLRNHSETTETVGSCNASLTNANKSSIYQNGTGRLLSSTNPNTGQIDVALYDSAGNTVFSTQGASTNISSGALQDRASYYGADNRLRAADFRTVQDPTNLEQGSIYRTVFEEYGYDALGRRVLVRARRRCEGGTFPNECNRDLVRRTVWSGDDELYEIQMPGVDTQGMENDSASVPNLDWSGNGGAIVDPNPIFGRVAYAHGPGIDQPLSITRIGYADEGVGGFRAVAPFTIVPLWDGGRVVTGTFGAGELGLKCETVQGQPRCVAPEWPATWYAYYRSKAPGLSWHGTLLQDKADAAGTAYRRNRYYDPNTGRFTQEDPIGLAGGLNAYGFADGDPVSYSDPYGLCPGISGTSMLEMGDCPPGWFEAWGMVAGAAGGYDVGAGFGAGGGFAAGTACGPAAAVCSPGGALVGSQFGGAVGAVGGAALGALLGRGLDILARQSRGGGESDNPQYKVRKPGVSGREAASDAPSWARGERPRVGENGNQFARRVLDDKYGAGNWKTGPGTEYNQIRKFGDRAFIDP